MSGNYSYTFPTDNQLSPSGDGSSPPSEAPATYKTSATRLDTNSINGDEQLPISRGVQYGGGRRREEDFLDSTITPTKLRPTITARKGLDEALPPSKDGKLFEERVLERRRELQGNAQGAQGCYVDSSGRRFHPTLHLPKDHQRHRSNSAGSQSSMMSHTLQAMDAYPQQGYMQPMQTYEPQGSLFQYHPASPMMMQHLLPHLSSPYPPYPVYSQSIQSYGPYLPDVNGSTYNQVYGMDISNEQEMGYNNLSADIKGADGQPAKSNLAGSQGGQGASFLQVPPAQASSALPRPTITVQAATPIKNLEGNTTEMPAQASSTLPRPTMAVQAAEPATPVKDVGGNTSDALLTANTLQSSSIPAPELPPAAPDSDAVRDGGQQPSAPPAFSEINDAKDMLIQMPEDDEHSDLDVGKFSDDDEDDQAAGDDSLKLPGGRPSKAKEKIMAGYVTQIRKLASEAAAQTGLTVSYIMTQASDPRDTRSGNCWNTWQRGYFEQFREEELRRLGIDPNDRPSAGSPVHLSIMRRAYKRFMSEHGNRGKEILRAWDAIQKFQDANMTVQQRVSHFKKETKKIKRLLDNLAASFNFQSALISVGGVVNQDQALCITHETSMADGFLQSLIANKDEEVFRGLFQSHVYGKAGQQYLEKMQNTPDQPPPVEPSCPQPEEAKLSSEETNEVASSNAESATRKIQEDAIRDCLQNLFGPKSKMEKHIHPRFLWRALGKELGKPSRRLTLLNWPEVAGFPTSNTNNKGLADLTSEKRSALYRAVKDEKFPLSKRSWDWAGNSLATAENSPVIQCLPMKDQRALCLYADGTVARDGQTLEELVAGLPAPPSKADKTASHPAGSAKAKSRKKGKGKEKAKPVAPKSMSIIGTDSDSESELDAAPAKIEGPPSSSCSAQQDMSEQLNALDRSQHSPPAIDPNSVLYPPFTQKDKSDDEDVFSLSPSPKEKKQAHLKPDAVVPPVHNTMRHTLEQTNHRTPTKSKSSAPPTNKTPTSKPFVKKRDRAMSTSIFDNGSSADEDDKRSKRSRTGSTTSSQWGDNISDKYMFDDHYSDNNIKHDAWNGDRYSSHQGPGSREMIRRRQSPLPSSGYPHPTAMHPYYPGHPGIPPIHPGGSPFYFANHSPYPPPPPPNHDFRGPPPSLYGHMAAVPSYNPMYPSHPGHAGPSRPPHLYQNGGHTRKNSSDPAYGQPSRRNHQDDDPPSPPRPPRWTGRREQRYDQEGSRQGRRAQKYDQEDM
ncbi:hypothetical protein CVT24_010058 [Panaeolus cyanescens]|uniref:Uncharacterized protein n=1 Tax=Panaeolus cyanescens TaxID=181874 RepID=A0A409YWE0_9AGAR|nr:hypothetical protein CVT24_010058 [Panaeolus cyanescens]